MIADTPTASVSLQPAMVTAAVVGVVMGLGKLWDHQKGKKRDRRSNAKLQEIQDDVREMKSEVRDLKAYVVGPDGQNGLRSEVRDHEQRLRIMESRGVQTPPDFPGIRPAADVPRRA